MSDVSLKHGTLWAYRCGCRCLDCSFARSEYARSWRQSHGMRSQWRGRSVKVDPNRLRTLIECEGRTAEEFCDDVGVSLKTLDRILIRGGACEGTLDPIACGLGCHMEQLIA